MQNPEEEITVKKHKEEVRNPQLKFEFEKEEYTRKTEERGEVKGEVRERVKRLSLKYTNEVMHEMLEKGLGKKKYTELKDWTKNHPGEEMKYKECLKYVSTENIKGEKDTKKVELKNGETWIWESALQQKKWRTREGLREMMKELFGIEVSAAPPKKYKNIKTVKKYTNAVIHKMMRKGLGEKKYLELKEWVKKHPNKEMSYEEMIKYVSTEYIKGGKDKKEVKLKNGETGIWNSALNQRKWRTKEGLREMMKELFGIPVKTKEERPQNLILSPKFIGGVYDLLMGDEEITIKEAAERVEVNINAEKGVSH